MQNEDNSGGLSIENDQFDWAYAGDSRLYHFHDGTLVYQTRDHSLSQIAVWMTV